jgi:threonine/homoserine/homoserine lactone efflux protein
MVLSSGVTFGFLKTIPHILGIAGGVVAMIIATGMGLGTLFSAYPEIYTALKCLGALYLLYLAWRIANSGALKPGTAEGQRPMRPWESAAFQWVNPKAWMMVIGAVTTYTTKDDYTRSLIIVALTYACVIIPCVGAWAAFGMMLRGVLSRPGYLRSFNIAMACLLVVSLAPLVSELVTF